MSIKDENFETWLNSNFMRLGVLRNVGRACFLIGFLHLAYFFFFGWTSNVEVVWYMFENRYVVSGIGMNEDLFYLNFLPGDWVKGGPIFGSCEYNMCIANSSRWASVIFVLILPFLIPFFHHYFVYQDEKSKNIDHSIIENTPKYKNVNKPTTKSTDLRFRTDEVGKDSSQNSKAEAVKTKATKGFKVIKKLKD